MAEFCHIEQRPEPKDLTHHLSKTTRNRQASKIKAFYKYFQIPGIGQLAGGLPNQAYFPYDTLEAKVALPNRWSPKSNKSVETTSPQKQNKVKETKPADSKLLVPRLSHSADVLKKIDVASALQYGTAQGYPPLYQFLRQFTRDHLHPNVPYKGGPEIILTVGNTDGFSKITQAFNNEWHEGEDPISEREGLLCEEYAYMGAIGQARPRGMNIVPVKVDDQGMTADGPGGLRQVLENWDFARGKRPHLLYTVTIGQNPTGGILSVQRRRDIYQICVEYDVIIAEDDPYWYLQYPEQGSEINHNGAGKSSGFPFLDSLVPSYLSVDYEGRVVRMDTFSKTVAPGCRLGWITAQPALIERILRITETSTQQPSGFVQAMVAELLMGPSLNKEDMSNAGEITQGWKDGNGWKFEGWVRWLEGLRGEYQRRMEAMVEILEHGKTIMKAGRRDSLTRLTADLNIDTDDSIPSDQDWSVIETTKIYDFVRPMGGMFLWIRFNFGTHPLASHFPGPQLSRALWVFWTRDAYKVLVSPGQIFAPTQEVLERDAWECFRLCFAAAESQDIVDATKRFVKGAKAFWRIKDDKIIQKILDELDEEEQSDAIAAAAAAAAVEEGEEHGGGAGGLGNLTWYC